MAAAKKTATESTSTSTPSSDVSGAMLAVALECRELLREIRDRLPKPITYGEPK